MIRAAILLSLQAAALLAGISILAPATAAGAIVLLSRRKCRSRVRVGAVLFVSFFAVLSLMAIAEDILGSTPPEFARYASLALRGYASFLIALAGTTMFSLTEVLCFLKKIRIPGYILTMIYLMVQDLAVFARLAAETARTFRVRGSGLHGLAKMRLIAHASGNFVILAALKFRNRHEHLLARGLALDLPLDDWRARERLR